jgi:hypothetical protein
MHSESVLRYAFNELQRYVDEQYWQVVKFKLGKRASLLSFFIQ